MSVVGRFVVLSLAGSFVGLFVLLMGRSSVRRGDGVVREFICVHWGGGGEKFVLSFIPFIGSFVLSSVLLFGGSFVPHIGFAVQLVGWHLVDICLSFLLVERSLCTKKAQIMVDM